MLLKKRSKIVPLLISVILLFISGCSDDDAQHAQELEPLEIGMGSTIQADVDRNSDQVFLGITLYDDSRKISLIAGDVIVSETQTHETIFNKVDYDSGFYSGLIDGQSINAGVDFSIQHLPVESRRERWYPADQSFVDPGPGEYVGLNWHTNFVFPEKIQLEMPEQGTIYHYADDTVNIDWDVNASAADTVRVTAIFKCTNQTAELYSGPNREGFGMTVKNMMDLINRSNETDFLSFTEAFIEIMTIGIIRFNTDPPDYYGDCEITIRVSVESVAGVNEPFVNGNVVSSRSDKAVIYYYPF